MNKKLGDNFLLFLLFVVVILPFIMFFLCSPAFGKIKDQPELGDYLCWHSSVKEPECGTYGWHKRKKMAMLASQGLCEKYCNDDCKLDYCEKLKRE